jgi:alpha-L-fucosidase 2
VDAVRFRRRRHLDHAGQPRFGGSLREPFPDEEFTCASTGAYRFYRFDFVPKAGVSHFQVAEIGLSGVDLGGAALYLSSPSGHSEGSGAGVGAQAMDISCSVDRDPATVWRVDAAPPAVVWQADLPRAVAVTSYTLTAAPDRPHTQNPGAPFANRGETRAFRITNSTAYRTYRLTFTPGESSTGFQVAEVALEGRGFDTRTLRAFVDYQRALDFFDGVHVTRFGAPGQRVLREAFAGRSADVMIFRYTSDSDRGLSGGSP